MLASKNLLTRALGIVLALSFLIGQAAAQENSAKPSIRVWFGRNAPTVNAGDPVALKVNVRPAERVGWIAWEVVNKATNMPALPAQRATFTGDVAFPKPANPLPSGEYAIKVRVWLKGNDDAAKPDDGNAQTTLTVREAVTGGLAFLVGIEDYSNPMLNLGKAADDAKSVQKCLMEQYGYMPDRIFAVYGTPNGVEISDTLKQAGVVAGKTVTKALLDQAFAAFKHKFIERKAHHAFLFYRGHGQDVGGVDGFLLPDKETIETDGWAQILLTALKDNDARRIAGIYDIDWTDKQAPDPQKVFQDRFAYYYGLRSSQPGQESVRDDNGSVFVRAVVSVLTQLKAQNGWVLNDFYTKTQAELNKLLAPTGKEQTPSTLAEALKPLPVIYPATP